MATTLIPVPNRVSRVRPESVVQWAPLVYPTVCLRPPPASRSSQMRNVHSVRSASAGVDRCAGGERLAELDAARHDVGGDVEVREAPLKLAEALSRGG